MKRWFNTQPIHRKLVLTSMAKTTVVLFAAMVVLLVVDVVRFQRAATASAGALAAMMAENIRVALVIEDAQGVADTLETVRLQASVQHACAYGSQDKLFSQYARDPSRGCAPTVPSMDSWRVLGALAPVEHDGESLRITASIGLGDLRPGDRSEDLLQRADAALYRAKHGGRNRVEVDFAG